MYRNGSFFTVGGVEGIIKMYNIIGRESIFGNTIVFEDPNLVFTITSDNYIRGLYNGQVSNFCGSNTRQEALLCLWNYLADNYYLEITASKDGNNTIKFTTDSNGTLYFIFENRAIAKPNYIFFVHKTDGEDSDPAVKSEQPSRFYLLDNI